MLSKTSSRYLALLEDSLLDNIYGSHSLIGNQGPVSAEDVNNGTYWPLRGHTMIGKRRLQNIHQCFLNVVSDNIPGDLIETGVWRGGACIYMKALVEVYGQDRKVYVADSFKGLPNPDERYPQDANPEWVELRPHLAISKATVEENFKKYNLLDETVIFVEGWFEHSLAMANINRLAILRLDGDMYSSTIQVLDQLYDKVSSGGYIIIDDYNLPSCCSAVSDFRARRNITAPIIPIDGCGSFWRKL